MIFSSIFITYHCYVTFELSFIPCFIICVFFLIFLVFILFVSFFHYISLNLLRHLITQSLLHFFSLFLIWFISLFGLTVFIQINISIINLMFCFTMCCLYLLFLISIRQSFSANFAPFIFKSTPTSSYVFLGLLYTYIIFSFLTCTTRSFLLYFLWYIYHFKHR